MKVILMNSHISLSTQHKLPIPVLGKSQEKYYSGVPASFVVSIACSIHQEVSGVYSTIVDCQGTIVYLDFSFSHISNENYTPREGHELQIWQMIVTICVTWVDRGTCEHSFSYKFLSIFLPFSISSGKQQI